MQRSAEEVLEPETFEQVKIDHLVERRRLLALRNRLEGIAWKLADRYERRLDQPGWEPEARDLASIVTVIERLTVVGAGLPKEHRVEVNGHDEMVLNRQQMLDLEAKAWEFREFCRVHRRGLYKDLPVEDPEVVDVPPAMRKKGNGEGGDAIAG